MKAVNVDEVLKILHKYGKYIFVTDYKKYSDMVDDIANLKALKQEPNEDCISREQALDPYKILEVTDTLSVYTIRQNLAELPSVTPTRPKGKWIMTNDYLTTAYGSIDYVKCSCCGEDSLEEGKYCPNCGADMREGEV